MGTADELMPPVRRVTKARVRVLLAEVLADAKRHAKKTEIPFLCHAVNRATRDEVEREAALTALKATAVEMSGPEAVKGIAWWEAQGLAFDHINTRLTCIKKTQQRFAVKRRTRRAK